MTCSTPTPSKKALPADELTLFVDTVATGDFENYDRVVVMFSGGKDSVACVLRLLELGCPKEKLELWHHDIDGREGRKLMDWPVTPAYCQAVADALELPLRFSWKVGGFEGEMMREDTPTAATRFELADGTVGETGGKGKAGTRLQFPQVAADLRVRWCSAYLKIDVADKAICNDPRLKSGRFLVVTGERREESGPRSRYAEVELHRASNKSRMVHHWRAVIDMGENEIWDMIKAAGVVPHPCYRLGWSRASCAFCIFGNANQWASARDVLPEGFENVAELEELFEKTIHRTKSVRELADAGESYLADDVDAEALAQARGETYDAPVLVDPSEWTLPSGAFKGDSGPV
jgi:3'-phosphoadenosine 5'-phosphosulfate sulfotransferase (PAPS reductase)/FAD synthetase